MSHGGLPQAVAAENIAQGVAVSGQSILYEDSFCRLTKSQLIIKNYYFPVGNKTIDIADIENIEPHRYRCLLDKGWGAGLDMGKWWARDFGRPFKDAMCIVVIAKKKCIAKGFSCDNVEAFFTALNRERQFVVQPQQNQQPQQ